MNNKGFTLTEILVVLILISLVAIFVIRNFSTTLSLGKEESYQIMKNSIISASYDYISECESGTISCNFSYEDNKNFFSAKELKEKGYFKNLNSPIDGKNLEDCLIIKVKKENGVVISTLEDSCY